MPAGRGGNTSGMNGRLAIAALAAAVLVPAGASAEATVGVRGYVIDTATNKPLPGAAVVIARLPVADAADRTSVLADRKGFFAQLGLAPGTYAVTANVEGHTATCVIDDIDGGLTRDVRIYLSPDSGDAKCVRARLTGSLVDPDQSAAIYTVR